MFMHLEYVGQCHARVQGSVLRAVSSRLDYQSPFYHSLHEDPDLPHRKIEKTGNFVDGLVRCLDQFDVGSCFDPGNIELGFKSLLKFLFVDGCLLE